MTPRARHVGIPQHPRNLLDSRLPDDNRHIARRHAALAAFRHDQLLIGVRGDLRQMRDHECLPSRARHIDQGRADPGSDLAADSLVDFVEHQRWDDVVSGQHDLEGQHQSRQFAARRDSS